MLGWGIEQLVRRGLADLSTAWDMASLHPANFLGLQSKSGLRTNAPADLVCFTMEQNKLAIQQTYKNGQLKYKNNT
jgi:N-acetylglucosamine-6-phosphate deacetylase